MKRFSGKLAWLGFAAVFALLMFWPQRDDPEMMGQVACTADAFTIIDHFRIVEESGADVDDKLVARWRDTWSVLDREVISLRRTGRAEPAYLGGMIASAVKKRDARLEAGDGAAWLAETMTKVETCSG